MKPSLLTCILVMGFTCATASAQTSAYSDVPCGKSYIRAEGLSCQKGPEFKAADGTVRGNYYVARGNFDRVRMSGNLQMPAEPGFVNVMPEPELAGYLKGYNAALKNDGADWSSLGKQQNVLYLTVSYKNESCYVFRRYGPPKLRGVTWRIDGFLCAPRAQKLDEQAALALINRFQVVTTLD